MAKPTDELPDGSPDKKTINDATLDSNSTSDSAPATETEFIAVEEPNPEEEIQSSDTDTDSASDLVEKEEPPVPAEDDSQASDDDGLFLTADGQDPTKIAMQIDQGTGAESVDYLDEDNLLQQVAGVFLLWWHWAYFEITVTSPNLPIYNPPRIIQPATVTGTDEYEFVYDISDCGYKLSTSKGEDMYSVGMSMCKMFYTIEKMIDILTKRIKDGGISTETEVQVTFDGHLLAQRKAFESIINLNYNVVVTNFDPGTWGERYLEIVKRLSDRGYGYPSEAPREIYKINKRSTSPTKP